MAAFIGQQATLEAAAKLLGARPTVARLGYSEPDGPGAFGVSRRPAAPRLPTACRRRCVSRSRRINASASPLAVEPGECYTAAGFALDGLTDVNLRVLDDEGSEVARDASQRKTPSAQFCAERHAEYAAELHGAQRRRQRALAVVPGRRGIDRRQSGLWLGERPLANASTHAARSSGRRRHAPRRPRRLTSTRARCAPDRSRRAA